MCLLCCQICNVYSEDIDIKDLEKYFLASSQGQAPGFSPKTFITHNKVILRLINISNSNAFTIFILTNIICQVFFVRCSLRGYSSCIMLRKPLGVMVSSPDQTQQAPFMFFLIIHYFERPVSSVRLVKSIHLRAMPQYQLIHEL